MPSGLFQAQVWDQGGVKQLGTAVSQSAVAAIAADHKGVSVKELKLKRTSSFMKDEHIERFKMNVYTDTTGAPALMSDIISSAETMTDHHII